LHWLRRHFVSRWQGLPLQSKIVTPTLGLMVAAAAVSFVAFLVGTARAQEALLVTQTDVGAAMVRYALTARSDAVSAAALALAGDPSLAPGGDGAAAAARAGAALAELGLDVVVAQDGAGQRYVGAASPGVPLPEAVQPPDEPGEPFVQPSGDSLLLLRQVALPAGGVLTAGIDLQRELLRTAAQTGQPSNLTLSLGAVSVSVTPAAGLDPQAYRWHDTVLVGTTVLSLEFAPRPADFGHAITMGLAAMTAITGSVMLAILLLGFALARALSQPVRDLAVAAEAVSHGDFSRRVKVPAAIDASRPDEVAVLSRAFNTMVDELQTLYSRLDARVADRTRQLVTATEVARTTSGSLSLDDVLPSAVALIRERFGFDSVAVYLKDPGQPWVELHEASYDEATSPPPPPQVLLGDHSPIGQALASAQQQVSGSALGQQGVEEAALPLLAGETLSGVLAVRSPGKRITGGELSALTIVADQLALAVHNSRLHSALLQYAGSLRDSNRELEAFAHTVAHDLKSPVYIVTTLAELLSDEIATATPEQVQDWASRLLRTGYKMDSIIKELLLLATVRQNAMPPLMALDMESVVDQAQMRLAHLVGEYHAEVVVAGAWPMARGYGPWVEEVWVNYVSNAIKYGGRPPLVELGADEPVDGFVRFWVRDNGAGLPPEDHGRLFKEFYRLPEHAPRVQGNGLGLWIVQRIVERLGGEVGLRSAPGSGSTFSFTLPRDTDPDATDDAAP
jgi:signal transduction histidine kinase/HAMP domain-containing protein